MPNMDFHSSPCKFLRRSARILLAKGKYLGVAACVLALAAGAQSAPGDVSVAQKLAADLTWTQAQRDARFAHMDAEFPVHTVRRGAAVRSLPRGKPLNLRGMSAVRSYMQAEHMVGVLVLQNGTVRAEVYGLGLAPGDRWTSFSVTKSVTDTLVGVALQRGWIHRIDDRISLYLPQMRGSAYDDVTVRQLMTMTSGVRWDERYDSPDADNVRLYAASGRAGADLVTEYMRRLPRESAPGTRWRYNTGETDLLGVVLQRASKRSLADMLSESIWSEIGTEKDAFWIVSEANKNGIEFGGSGLSATLRDWGRFGQWVLEGGPGQVPPGWFGQATRAQVQAGDAAYGYGWWPQPDGAFAALGIFGQSIFIDPKRQMVVVSLGDWAEATGAEHTAARRAFWRTMQDAVDAR